LEYLEYGDKELNYLKESDKDLAKVIDKYGFIKRKVIPDPFTALVHSIAQQQISLKAANTVCSRIKALLGDITPESIEAANVDELRSCGLSGRKINYIKGIAKAVLSGKLNFNSLYDMSDDQVIKKLSSLPGVGVWTAEMLLISSMRRPDVVSFSDLAIRRGMLKVYGLKSLTKEQFLIFRKRYSPYGTIASIYLWAASKE
jgi:3-methyladenine DNA glycosylase/8-oxoguanine DNA glycosylase